MTAPEALARAGELRAVAAECAGQALHRIACALSNPNVSSLAVALGALVDELAERHPPAHDGCDAFLTTVNRLTLDLVTP